MMSNVRPNVQICLQCRGVGLVSRTRKYGKNNKIIDNRKCLTCNGSGEITQFNDTSGYIRNFLIYDNRYKMVRNKWSYKREQSIFGGTI